jgi:hypothetical protein
VKADVDHSAVKRAATARRDAAARQRKCRALKKIGRVGLRIEADRMQIVAALRLARGYSDEQRLPRKLIERDLAEFLEIWAERWLRTGHG